MCARPCVLGFKLAANRATGESGNNHTPNEIVEVEGLSVSSLEDRQVRLSQLSQAKPKAHYDLYRTLMGIMKRRRFPMGSGFCWTSR
jgi:hypothetical protein